MDERTRHLAQAEHERLLADYFGDEPDAALLPALITQAEEFLKTLRDQIDSRDFRFEAASNRSLRRRRRTPAGTPALLKAAEVLAQFGILVGNSDEYREPPMNAPKLKSMFYSVGAVHTKGLKNDSKAWHAGMIR